MSLTDLERDLRATLEEAGQRAPVVDDLALRAVRPVRRRRLWLATGVGVVSVGVVGVAIAITTPGEENGTVVSTPSPSVSATALGAALIGTWRPVDIAGFDPSKLSLSHSRNAAVTFRGDGRWRGTDGCNGIGGTYSASNDGTITADDSGATTDIGCDNVPNRAVLARAARFTIDGRSLTFYAADGSRLAIYEGM
jgi:heat shock protein HslJ